MKIAIWDDVFDVHEDAAFAAVIGEGFGDGFVDVHDVDDVGFVKFSLFWQAVVYCCSEGAHLCDKLAHAVAGGGGVDGEVFGDVRISQANQTLLR